MINYVILIPCIFVGYDYNVVKKGSVYMILMYTSFGCTSALKAKQYLDEHNLPYVEKNIQNTPLNKEEIKYLLMRSPNGTEDIISKRSKPFKELHTPLEDLSINDLVSFIQVHPTVLKRPIIVNQEQFVVGYDEDEITSFIPPHLRTLSFKECCHEGCEYYEECSADKTK